MQSPFFLPGVPLDLLNEEQRNFLHNYGACKTLFLLNEITCVYKATTPEIAKAIWQQSDRGDATYFTQREQQALEFAQLAAKSHFYPTDNGTVFLIFGHAHDFKKYTQHEVKFERTSNHPHTQVSSQAAIDAINSTLRLLNDALQKIYKENKVMAIQLLKWLDPAHIEVINQKYTGASDIARPTESEIMNIFTAADKVAPGVFIKRIPIETSQEEASPEASPRPRF